MKRILVLLAEGFEETEAVSAVDVLRRGDVSVTLCSLGETLVEGSRHMTLKADTTIDRISAADFDGIYLPGGTKGAETLRDDARVQQLIRTFYDSGKKVTAICAAPIALERAGILKGARVTSNPGVRDVIQDADYLEDPVVVSGNIITSRAAGTTIPVALELLRQLGLDDGARRASRGMMFDFLMANQEKVKA
ncbi:MAG: DJ-1/PfpI family protein [Sporolactobacillus sp.]|nr:DJ-1/PfpI family protein [Sporolactobacillus sp.]MCI1882738.1 DJ-1/PfpI family protein [Sporolactobacillus sp.]